MIARIVVLLLLFSAAACAQPAGPDSSTPSNGRHGAPLPSDPRDVRPLSADPCSALEPSQLLDLGLRVQGEVVVLPTNERSCEWRGADGSPHVNLGIAGDRDILVDTYRVRQLAVFRPTTIGGLPGSVEQTAEGSISCNVTVGTADGQGFLVIYDAELGADGQPLDPCGRARYIAEQTVAALPPLPGK
ncbi:DUF3558 domain-containing protein [Actinomycetospora rhizophila]|uniref:DUF3558 domain-containing protein n=1 Tax=Actinomycetospora rhizophila TaxID=1416876 RepID=A0ABV9Z779_9PSEU